MPKFRILLKGAESALIAADGWQIKDEMVIFVAEGEAGKTAADPVEQSKRIAAVVKFSELVAIVKVKE